MTVIRQVPWTAQPQAPVGISAYWLARGLTFLNLGSGLYWQKNRGWFGNPTTINGGPLLKAGIRGIARGYGSTFGTGTTDRVDSGVVATSPTLQRSIISHFYMNGSGGGGLGRIFQDTTGAGNTNGDEALYLNTAGTNMAYTRMATATGQWYIAVATPTGRWTSFGVSFDSSSISNVPLMYADGISTSITAVQAPTGSFVTTGTTLAWGNRPSDNARNWDGLHGPTAFFDCILTAAEFKALNDNIWQILAPLPRTIWAPAAGGGNPTITSAVTEGADTMSASLDAQIAVTSSVTEGADTSSASLSPQIAVTSSVTEGADTMSSSIATSTTITSAVTEGADTMSASLDAQIAVSSAVTEGADVMSALVSPPNTVASAVTEGADTSAATVTVGSAATPGLYIRSEKAEKKRERETKIYTPDGVQVVRDPPEAPEAPAEVKPAPKPAPKPVIAKAEPAESFDLKSLVKESVKADLIRQIELEQQLEQDDEDVLLLMH